jgi:hypothetical protein
LTGSDPLVVHFTAKDYWMTFLVVSQGFAFLGSVRKIVGDWSSQVEGDKEKDVYSVA